MAYIKERGENTYPVRITIGTDGHGKPIQKSRTFHPSRTNLPKTKLKKELDAFVDVFESEYKSVAACHNESVFACQGNKRIGMYVLLTFLETNGIKIRPRSEEVVRVGLATAAGEMKYEDILAWILENE